ncbi:MAG: VapE domain-containing protein [Bacteroidota bacterium]|uniref:VapE domain-containing protein n=1 Tax=Runella sp. TaxID=1960881 RepID=UPI00301902AB
MNTEKMRERLGEPTATGEAAPPKSPKAITKIRKIEQFLEDNAYALRYNVVKNAVEFSQNKSDWRDLDDRTAKRIEAELLHDGINGVERTLNVVLSNAPDFDPMAEYLKKHTWDGRDHITALANFVEMEADRRDWFNLMFKKHLVRLVACAVGKLKFNKQAVIFFGKQGDGKSSFLRALVPPELRPYYTENIEFDNKDGLIALARNYVINLDELTSLSRHDITKIKAFLSYETVKARLPFDRRETNLRRRATFFGSTNQEEFLTDETGNVRWLVMPITGIKHDHGGLNGYASVNINQVYAQAAALIESGFAYELNAEEIAQNEGYNSGHLRKPPEYELIVSHFEPTNNRDDFKTPTNIADIIDNKSRTKISPVMIGKALLMLNNQSVEKWKFEKISQRVNGIAVKGYLLKVIIE